MVSFQIPILTNDEIGNEMLEGACSGSCRLKYNTVNRKYFDVKIFSDSMACAKIKRTKYMRNINDKCGTGSFVRKLFNTKYYRMKYFRHEIFAIYGILLYPTHSNSPSGGS